MEPGARQDIRQTILGYLLALDRLLEKNFSKNDIEKALGPFKGRSKDERALRSPC